MAQDTEPARPGAAGAKPGETRASPAMAGAESDRAEDSPGEEDSNSATDGFARLHQGHKELRALLGECEKVGEDGAEDLLSRLTRAWAGHAAAHAALFDCAVEAGLEEFSPLNEAGIETDLASFLLRRAGRDLENAMQLAGLRVAARLIGNIIEQEDKPRSGILAKVKGAGVDPDDLGRRIDACKQAQPATGGANRPQLRHLVVNQEDIMPRNMPERDEEGRFVSDRDHRGRSGGSGRGGRYDDDDRRSSSRSSRYDDDDRRYSRSRQDDDDDRRYSRGSRYDDDDRGYSRDRGQGGWFGDPEGHSEASRKGWARRDDDDDRSSRGRGGSGRYDDDDRRYSRSSRYDDDDRRYSRGSRYDDDDRSYSRDRGQGGWFGDSEGHSEAAELGWDRRRREGDDRGSRRGRY